MIARLSIWLLIFGLLAGTAAAQDAGGRPPLTLSFGLLTTDLDATEIVRNERGRMISHLGWTSQVPVLSMTAGADLPDGFTFGAALRVALGQGSGQMIDTDWNDATFGTGFGPDDWTDRSVHPDTRLDHYLHAELTFGRDLPLTDTARINLHGGVQTMAVKWTAYGGSYLYSTDDVRDAAGEFTPGERGITYEQRLPGLFLGMQSHLDRGPWRFEGLMRAGITLQTEDRDHHWLRALRFDNAGETTPFATLRLRAAYCLDDRRQLWASVDHSRTRRQVMDTMLIDQAASPPERIAYPDAGALDFRETSIGAGLDLKF